MPTLSWTGKEAVVNHHLTVPFRLLKDHPDLSFGDPETGNILMQGDNLEGLKALLPYYAGQVDCICIDPPYNTGNEGWVYNDNVNSAEINEWLGKVVGKEAEDLNRHAKWLCMMYPRLKLLREFLSPNGSIFVFIDDNEFAHLRMIMDEIFSGKNFVTTVIWQKNFAPKNSAKHFSEDHDYVLVYANNAETWRPNLLPRSDDSIDRYKNPDEDLRGPWTSGDLQARNYYSEGTYPVTCPSGRVIPGPGKGMYWRVSETKFKELDQDRRIWWGKDGNNMPRLKRFLSEVKDGVTPQTLWFHGAVGHTQEAKKELLQLVDFDRSEDVFITPKPTRVIERVIQLATTKESIVLDSFGGSGTTAQAVMKQNAGDNGNRKFITIEMLPEVAQKVTQKRLVNAAKAIAPSDKAGDTANPNGFRYVSLGQTLFDPYGQIRETVTFGDLARHVWFTETGSPLPKAKVPTTPLLGTWKGTAIYLLYNGILGDESTTSGNILNRATLAKLPPHDGPKTIYASGCMLSADLMSRNQAEFKQTPYQIRTR